MVPLAYDVPLPFSGMLWEPILVNGGEDLFAEAVDPAGADGRRNCRVEP